MIIYLYYRLPGSSHTTVWRDVPGDTTGRRIVSCFVLLRMGFTQPPHVTAGAVVSYTAIPPLPQIHLRRFLFCCTFLRVASTGRYPASCPMKPGLSSPFGATIRAAQTHVAFYHGFRLITRADCRPATIRCHIANFRSSRWRSYSASGFVFVNSAL